MFMEAKPAAVADFKMADRSAPMYMPGSFRLGIPKAEGLADKASDEVTSLNGATRVTPEHLGASLHEVEASVVADDSIGGGRGDLEGSAVELHGNVLQRQSRQKGVG